MPVILRSSQAESAPPAAPVAVPEAPAAAPVPWAIQNEIARDQARLQICQTSTDINSTPLSLHGRLSALHCLAPMINIMKSPTTEYLAAISSPRLSQPRLQSQRRQAVSGDQRKKHILIMTHNPLVSLQWFTVSYLRIRVQ